MKLSRFLPDHAPGSAPRPCPLCRLDGFIGARGVWVVCPTCDGAGVVVSLTRGWPAAAPRRAA